ncbi:Temptin [Phytophthora nicotianae]|uniref:Temptin n=1 Tax=Phytophthora nicotianae TaxID=4792 RepID=A0A0W8DQQ9_PHYNI|nr:Temptin [Phytophthora nicotianae]
MAKAGRLVESKPTNVIYSGCSAHALNLLLKDIFTKLNLFSDVLKKAVKVTKFVRIRGKLLRGIGGTFRSTARCHPSKVSVAFDGLLRRQKSWNEETKAENSKYPPLDWWTTQDDMPVLQDFAAKVLSSPTSSAASDRLWSTQGFIHSKARNKLRVRRVEKLSFVRTNGGDKSTRSEVIYQTPPVVESDDDMSSDEEDTSVFDFDSDDFALLLESIANFDGEYDDSDDEGEGELADEANDEGGDNF